MGTFPPDEPDDPLAGLRVAITGGTSGLGLALVRELLGRGARVAFVARTRAMKQPAGSVRSAFRQNIIKRIEPLPGFKDF